MADKYILNKILSENKITDFLSERGINPVKNIRDRLIYHCPVHTGDREPSFVVYNADSKEEPQNYYCYGCHSGSTIIDLIADIDKISNIDAFKRLFNKINIDEEERRSSIISEIKDSHLMSQKLSEMGFTDIRWVEMLFLKISSFCRMHIESTDKDEEEIDFFHKLYKIIEDCGRKKDGETLTKMYNFLFEALEKRLKEYKKKKEEIWKDNPWK